MKCRCEKRASFPLSKNGIDSLACLLIKAHFIPSVQAVAEAPPFQILFPLQHFCCSCPGFSLACLLTRAHLTSSVQAVAEACQVSAMPTFQVFKGGKKVDELVGASPPKLEELLKKYS